MVYPLFFFVGGIMGLVGSGGSLLVLPILVYFLGIPLHQATAYSLFLVGGAALISCWKYAQNGSVDFKLGTLFAAPSILSVFLVRKFVVPNLPTVFHLSFLEISIPTDFVIWSLFSVMMLGAAWAMLKGKEAKEKKGNNSLHKKYSWLVIFEGVLVGIVTGLVGAGGGFLIVPTLVLGIGLSMKLAVGTSLWIISAKSLLGFTGDVFSQSLDWSLLLILLAISLTGSLVGEYASHKVSQKQTKYFFGYLVIGLACVILIYEIVKITN